jgi:hypothetical protein
MATARMIPASATNIASVSTAGPSSSYSSSRSSKGNPSRNPITQGKYKEARTEVRRGQRDPARGRVFQTEDALSWTIPEPLRGSDRGLSSGCASTPKVLCATEKAEL